MVPSKEHKALDASKIASSIRRFSKHFDIVQQYIIAGEQFTGIYRYAIDHTKSIYRFKAGQLRPFFRKRLLCTQQRIIA